METAGNVIFFRRTGREEPEYRIREAQPPVTVQEEISLLCRARKVVDEMEALWEQDHARPELRDKLHLLRHYLGRLPERPLSESKSTPE
jgi:hypothetical protein